MRVQLTDRKTFELTDNSKELGRIAYDNWFSYKANVVVGNDNYRITPKGFFNVTISVTKNDKEVANMNMNWKGHIMISFRNGEDFILKPTGTFQTKYVLEDKNQQKLLLLNPDFDWSKFIYNYNISDDNKTQNVLLVLLAIYSANYCMAVLSAG